MTNTPHSEPDDCTPTLENSPLAEDWNLTESGILEESAVYDGKIIARMPDLGSNGNVISSIERQKFPSVWKNVYRTMTSAENRQQFFKRITAFGGAVLLCGIGILFFEQSDKDPVDNVPVNNAKDIAEMMPERSIVTVAETIPLIKYGDGAEQPTETLSESSALSVQNTGKAIPVADIAAVQRSVEQPSPKTDSPWDRPVGNTYSPWNVTHKQPESTTESAAPAAPATPPTPVAAAEKPITSPPAPSAAPVEMTPMTPLSMPISPYEQQLFVAQTVPPVRAPVDPFLQPNAQHPNVQSGNSPVPGMVQTHQRLENPVNPSVNPPVPQPQYQQPIVPQGRQPAQGRQSAQERQPVTIPPQGYNNGQPMPMQNQHSQHGQYGQYNQYTGAPVATAARVSATNVPAQNMPIPSGVSTLKPQEGYYPQPSGNVPAQNDNFHPNVTPAYRRVY